MGVDLITVHGRTRYQKSSNSQVDLSSIRFVCESASVPIIANGDVFTPEDAQRTFQETGSRGVMAARGLLHNPNLFSGAPLTTWSCVESFVKLSLQLGPTSFFVFHHHLMFMLDSQMCKTEKKMFNSLTSMSAVVQYLQDNYCTSAWNI
jgi:tRNA-dihydrouridine synthase 4